MAQSKNVSSGSVKSVTVSRWSRPSMSGQYSSACTGAPRAARSVTSRLSAFEKAVEIGLFAGNSGAIGEGNSDRRDFRRRSRVDEGGAEIKETRPFSRILGGGRLPVGAIDNGIGTITHQSAFRNLSVI